MMPLIRERKGTPDFSDLQVELGQTWWQHLKWFHLLRKMV